MRLYGTKFIFMHEKDVQTAAKLFPLIFPREMRNSKFDIPLCSYVIEYTKLGTISVPLVPRQQSLHNLARHI